MDDLPWALRVVYVLYGAAVLVWCWRHAVRSRPATTQRPERWAVALAAMASVTIVFGGLGLMSWLGLGGLAALCLLAGAAMLALGGYRLTPEPRRAPRDWSDQ